MTGGALRFLKAQSQAVLAPMRAECPHNAPPHYTSLPPGKQNSFTLVFKQSKSKQKPPKWWLFCVFGEENKFVVFVVY